MMSTNFDVRKEILVKNKNVGLKIADLNMYKKSRYRRDIKKISQN